MSLPQARTVDSNAARRNVFFHILTACNLSCRHCYINPKEHGTDTISRENLEKWLQLFQDENKETNVIFLGGEPTMHPDLPHAIRFAKKLGYSSVTVDTNGFLFHDFLEKATPAGSGLFKFQS